MKIFPIIETRELKSHHNTLTWYGKASSQKSNIVSWWNLDAARPPTLTPHWTEHPHWGLPMASCHAMGRQYTNIQKYNNMKIHKKFNKKLKIHKATLTHWCSTLTTHTGACYGQILSLSTSFPDPTYVHVMHGMHFFGKNKHLHLLENQNAIISSPKPKPGNLWLICRGYIYTSWLFPVSQDSEHWTASRGRHRWCSSQIVTFTTFTPTRWAWGTPYLLPEVRGWAKFCVLAGITGFPFLD